MLSSDKHWLVYASTETSEKKAGAAKSWTLIRSFVIISLAIATFAQARTDDKMARVILRIVARAFGLRRNREANSGGLRRGWVLVKFA